jgi:hypothetical protein
MDGGELVALFLDAAVNSAGVPERAADPAVATRARNAESEVIACTPVEMRLIISADMPRHP